MFVFFLLAGCFSKIHDSGGPSHHCYKCLQTSTNHLPFHNCRGRFTPSTQTNNRKSSAFYFHRLFFSSKTGDFSLRHSRITGRVSCRSIFYVLSGSTLVTGVPVRVGRLYIPCIKLLVGVFLIETGLGWGCFYCGH